MDKLSKLLTFENKEELKCFIKKENMLDNYYEKMDRLSHDKEYCKMVWDARIDEKLRNIDAYNNGKEEGIEEGIEQNKIEMIINMLNDSVPIESISKYSNLSIDEINDIAAKYKK